MLGVLPLVGAVVTMGLVVGAITAGQNADLAGSEST